MVWLLYLGLAGGAYYAYKKLYHPMDDLMLYDPASDGGVAIGVDKKLPAQNRTELQMFFDKHGILDSSAKSQTEASDMTSKLCASLESQGYHITAINVNDYYLGSVLPYLHF